MSVRIQRRQPGDEQRRGVVGGEHDALGQARVGVVGPRHPVDERAHHRHPGEHRQVGEDRHLQRAGLGQLDRIAAADHPADLGRADIGGNRRNGSQDQDVGQVHVADAFFFATDFLPFLIGMGEEPPYMMDHAVSSSFLCGRPPAKRRARMDSATRCSADLCDLMSQYRNGPSPRRSRV